jgi:ribosome-binding factor A
MAEVKRASRVAERIREELSWMLTREVRDPGASGTIVSRVEVTDDLKTARIYVRTLEGKEIATTLEALKRASTMLRRQVTTRVGLRFAPELRFYYDDRLDAVNRIEQLLEEVKREDKPAGSSSS